MREILFRGKCTANGKWVYGDLLNVGVDYDYAIRTYGGREHGQVNAVNEKTVGQYTGLLDKDGKKVFEGDICQIKGISYIDETPFVVEWNEEFSGWFWKNLDFGSATDTITAEIAEMSRVIGNIHDNPELLKGE